MTEKSRPNWALLAATFVAAVTLAVLFMILHNTWPAQAAPGVWAVCPTTGWGCDFTVIQAAIDAAGTGDVIRVVGPHTYDENLIVTKSVTLRGGCADVTCTLPLPGIHVTTIHGKGVSRTITIRGEGQVITPAIDGFVITGGDATGEDKGGGIGSWNAALILTRSTITNNIATRDPSDQGYGGGIYVLSGTVAISHTDVLSNQAATSYRGYGGGICLESTSGLLAHNTLQGNTGSSGEGGGPYGYGGGLYAENCDPLTLTNNLIYTNTASLTSNGYSGGINLDDCRASLIENAVTDNLGSRDGLGSGGGIKIASGSDVTLSHNWIVSNTGSVKGTSQAGGVYFFGAVATMDGDVVCGNVSTLSASGSSTGDGMYVGPGTALTATNIVVARGGTPTRGAGLYLHGATAPVTVTLVNSTIISHTDEGILCISNEGITPTLVNVILWGNGDDLAYCSTAGLAYSDVKDVGDTGTGVIHLAPRFVDPAGNDFRLRYDSPCIDAGATPTTYTLVPGQDWEREARPAGSGYDIGADEFVPAYGARLIPAAHSGKATPGGTTLYTHILRNTGNTSDTYTVTVGSTQGWASLASSAFASLEPFAIAPVTVEIAVPLTATSDVTDAALIWATSWISPAAKDWSLDVTSVEYRTYLPLVLKN